MEQDRPLPFEKRCIIHEHRRLKDPKDKYKLKGKQPRMLRPEWCVDSSGRSSKARTVTVVKKRQTHKFNGVRKRCPHDQKDWDLCGCPWFFATTHNGTRHRGKILPAVATLAEARTAYALIAARVENGLPPIEAKPAVGITVAQLGEEWLSVPRDRKPSVIHSHRDHLRVHVVPVLGSLPVATLTHVDCERFVQVMSTKPLSPSTKQGALITLSALLTFAVQKKRLRTDNPATGLSKELRDPNAPRHRSLTNTDVFNGGEADLLLATCREHFPEWYPFVLTGISTGLRLGEIIGLRWSAIHWRRSFIHVKEAWVKGAWTTTKNRGVRDVTLSRSLRMILYLRWRQLRPGELVFPSLAGTPMEHSNMRRRLWTPLLKKADLSHRKIHAMRHTFASLLLQQGASLAWVQSQLGHRSMDITLNVYGHFIPGGQRGEADGLASTLGIARPPKRPRVFSKGTNGHDQP